MAMGVSRVHVKVDEDSDGFQQQTEALVHGSQSSLNSGSHTECSCQGTLASALESTSANRTNPHHQDSIKVTTELHENTYACRLHMRGEISSTRESLQ